MTEQAGELPDPWVMQHEFTSKRLNRLAAALGAKSYLEIGVHTGGTFARVQVAERTAVDPAFPFPVSDHEDDVTIFAEMTSDEFFAGLPAGKTYDLVFIDGLHTFEQTYRDLCNAIVRSHPAAPILVDDTVPSDVYSALRDPEQAFAFRAAAGPDGSAAWHGDTFKVSSPCTTSTWGWTTARSWARGTRRRWCGGPARGAGGRCSTRWRRSPG